MGIEAEQKQALLRELDPLKRLQDVDALLSNASLD